MNKRAETILAGLAVPLRVYLGVVFIAASLYKIASPYDFALSVATYQILPYWIINLFALTLPWIEFAAGVCLVLGIWTRAASVVIGGMMMMFLVALLIALSRDLKMSCGCFASQETVDEIGWHTVLRDLSWLAIAVYLCCVNAGRFGLDGLLASRRIAHDA